MVEGRRLLVSKIRNGTVIDHIPAGMALTVLRILGVTGSEGNRVALVMNVESGKLGRKDIVKIEDRWLSEDEANLIALIAPTATINIIKDYEVVWKRRVRLPSRIKGLIKCPNPTCISNRNGEPVTSSFTLVSRSPVLLKCDYCDTMISVDELLLKLNSR